MPLFMWRGITLDGSIKRGFMHMPSANALDMRLLEMDIALLNHQTAWHPGALVPIRTHHVKEFFQLLTTLVGAGVLLPESLDMVAGQIAHPIMQDVISRMAAEVRTGVSFHKALSQYPMIYTTLVVHVVLVGEETGTLGKALERISTILADDIERTRHIKSMLFVPLVTTCSMLTLIIFLVKGIIPHFVSVFASMKIALPPLTEALVTVGAFLTWGHVAASACIAIGATCLLMHKEVADQVTRGVLMVPCIGSLLAQHHVNRCYMSLGVLLQSGITIVPALRIVAPGVDLPVLRDTWARIAHDVSHGIPLSHTLRRHNERGFFRTDTIALIATGEETGLLAAMVNQAAFIEYERYKNRIKRLFTLLQPTLLIVLGIMVLLIVMAIYEPIMALSAAV